MIVQFYKRAYSQSLDRLRNFCIIAHVDHGKSTLADRLLLLTRTITKLSKDGPSLDTLPVERARGITVKTQTATMQWREYQLTLMDTPGHVDFQLEVVRVAGCCEGALLLIDAQQGIQAQTVRNYERSCRVGHVIVPVLNKVDVASEEQIANVERDLRTKFGFEECLKVSARTGYNCESILDAIIAKIPPPCIQKSTGNSTRLTVIDSHYDTFHGIICTVKVDSGVLRKGMSFYHGQHCTQIQVNATQIGILTPGHVPCEELHQGMIGYMFTGLKLTRMLRPGDCLSNEKSSDTDLRLPVINDNKPKQTVFAGFFPKGDDYNNLKKALQRLSLNDPAVSMEPSQSAVLGAGWRLGFLGTLHMAVFKERLKMEFEADCLVCHPTVNYCVILKDGTFKQVKTFEDFPSDINPKQVLEPWCRVTVRSREQDIGPLGVLVKETRGECFFVDNYKDNSVMVKFEMPLEELIGDFQERVLSLSQGYASLDYEPMEDKPSDIVPVQVLINGEPADMLSFLAHSTRARSRASVLLKRLKEENVIQRHQFSIALQASIRGKIIARETITAHRKDVTQKCYGGDGTRKKKLLEQQKLGKAKLKSIGRVEINPDAISALVSKR